MHEKTNIPEEHLRACLQEQYDLIPVTLDFLPLGHDTWAEVYRMVSEHGTPYFLKAKYGSLYEPGCVVPRYLRDQEIAAVVAPIPTKRNALWARVGEWTVIVYPFIDGDTGLNLGMADRHWKEMGTILKRIHSISPPPEGFPSMKKETFDPTQLIRWVREFETQRTRSEGGSVPERALTSCWMMHRHTISTLVTHMEVLARALRESSGPYVICHADLHANNILRDQADRLFVLDWDDVMMALRERDFLFVNEGAGGGGSGLQEPTPFFQGYGETEIDWIALTYYRCERVVQDVVEYAQCVFFRDDLGEETKVDAVQRFGKAFAKGRMVDAALAAAQHLPPDLAFRHVQGG